MKSNFKISTSLFEHQREGFEKLKKLTVGALYMEMGTGKTRLTLELIKYRLDRDKIDKVIWFCPCSAKGNLRKDLNKHSTGWENIIGIVGLESISQSVRLNSVLYDIFSNYKERVMLVVDESNYIKNYFTNRAERITTLSQMCKYKIILNGTPITKNEADLFAQWYVLDWRILGYRSYFSFEHNHIVFSKYHKNRIAGIRNVDYLVRKIAPYTFQKTKEECLDLPDKHYYSRYFDIGNRGNYEYVCGQFLNIDEDEDLAIFQMFSALQAVTSGYNVDVKKSENSRTGKYITKEPQYKSYKDNPRIEALDNAIYEFNSKKIIIFVKYTDEIEWISQMLKKEYDSDVAYLHGGLSFKARDKEIDKFENNDNCKFLIANKACSSYALNLQFCNCVIYYNNDFNYGTRLQSEDRIHRIGSTKDCIYVDIVARRTLDETIIDNIECKGKLLNWFNDNLDKQKDVKSKINTVKKYIYYKETDELKDVIEEEIQELEDLNEKAK